ncbi:dUTP diphosphatase [Aeribacillus sp. FSL K6-8394]|uniref:dUTP diphosphatase n=1 Tax=Aeribacillus sp. FSL K6-8394 TaxID=2954570 RepID=UPI0030FB1F73
MNLSHLFELQAKLDERIEQQHPRQDGEDRLAKKILALMVELGELCQEWRGFKFWSHDQVPRTRVLVNRTTDDIGFKNIGPEHIKNPLLEEFADALHFILSIGLELNIPEIYGTETKWDELTSDETDITQQFLLVFENVNKLVHPIDWINLFEEFYILGEMLGFTWEQIEAAYMQKNAENHRRQDSNY